MISKIKTNPGHPYQEDVKQGIPLASRLPPESADGISGGWDLGVQSS